MNSQTHPQKFRSAILSGASLYHLKRLSTKLQDIQCRDPSTRETSLMLACKKGRVDICYWLILDENHEDVEISRDSAGETILHLSASLGHSEILLLYLTHYPFVLEWTNLSGATALHSASKNGKIEIISILINYGINMNSMDLNGNTPLIYASTWGRLGVVRRLIFEGAETEVVNNEGFSAVDYAYSFAGVKAIDEFVKEHYEAQKQERRNLRKQSKMSTISDNFDPLLAPRISKPDFLQTDSSSALFVDSPIVGYTLDENVSPNTSGFSFESSFSPTTTSQFNNLPFPTTTSGFEDSISPTSNILLDLPDQLTLSPESESVSNNKDSSRRRGRSTTASSKASSIISTNSDPNANNLSPSTTRSNRSRSNSISSPLSPRTTLLPLSISIPPSASTSSTREGPTSHRREISSPNSNSNSDNSYNSNSTHWIGSPIDPNLNTNTGINTGTNTNTTVTPSTPRPTLSSNPTKESIKSSTTTSDKEKDKDKEKEKDSGKSRNGSSDTTGSKMARAFGLGLRRKT